MKLVDILARELTEWPGDVGAITQDKLNGELLDYYHCPLRGGNEREVSSIADDAGEAYYCSSGAAATRTEWQAAVGSLKVVEWDGAGLPPVGLDVEVMQGGLPSVAFDWEACKILAINIGSDDKPQVITRDFRGDAAIYYPDIDSVHFRHIRTAEQVAAEEIRSIIESGLNGNKTMTMVVKEIIEAGYRKQVAK